MKRIIALILSVLFFPQFVLAYYNPGQPTGFVNDFANLLEDGARVKLEDELKKFEVETKHEIVVVTVKNLQEDTIENFAVKLFEDWQIGKKGADNGVLLLVSAEDRKMRIEVGYGLEGALPDATAYKIINQIIKPSFQANDYNKGIIDGVEAIKLATKGEDVSSLVASSGSGKSWGKVFDQYGYFIFAMFFVFFRALFNAFSSSKRWWPGGVWGGLAGLIAGLIVAGVTLNILWFIFSFSFVGLFLDYFASKKGPGSGGPGGFWGGFLGGGSGGLGGGGFGGFGGGGSGGGGSSGDW